MENLNPIQNELSPELNEADLRVQLYGAALDKITDLARNKNRYDLITNRFAMAYDNEGKLLGLHIKRAGVPEPSFLHRDGRCIEVEGMNIKNPTNMSRPNITKAFLDCAESTTEIADIYKSLCQRADKNPSWSTAFLSFVDFYIDNEQNPDDKELFQTLLQDNLYPHMRKAFNSYAKKMLLNPDQRNEERTERGLRLLRFLDEAEAVDYKSFVTPNILTNPEVARLIARQTDKDVFSDIPNSERISLSSNFFNQVIAQISQDSTRRTGNISAINRMICEKYPGQSIPMRELILFANYITGKINSQKPELKQQEELPCSNQAPDLIHASEAMFRILEITAADERHVAENRAYAELFDAILQPVYSQFERSVPLTIADICARYPDVSKDISLELHDIATSQGYPAATQHYEGLIKAAFWKKRKPGYGPMS